MSNRGYFEQFVGDIEVLPTWQPDTNEALEKRANSDWYNRGLRDPRKLEWKYIYELVDGEEGYSMSWCVSRQSDGYKIMPYYPACKDCQNGTTVTTKVAKRNGIYYVYLLDNQKEMDYLSTEHGAGYIGTPKTELLPCVLI